MAKKKGKTKVSELEKLNQDLLDLRLKHASMALKETHKISETKKDIARLKTKITFNMFNFNFSFIYSLLYDYKNGKKKTSIQLM